MVRYLSSERARIPEMVMIWIQNADVIHHSFGDASDREEDEDAFSH
jgi:hypothetical protein